MTLRESYRSSSTTPWIGASIRIGKQVRQILERAA